MKTILYGNGGSGNHGCEAIVRGTYALFREPLMISSVAVEEDKKYGLENFCEVYNAKTGKPNKLQFAKAYAQLKIKGDYTAMDGLPYLNSIKQFKERVDLALSVGGDNYCYSNQRFYAFLNKAYRRNGIKTVLWGCSVEPEVLKNKEILEDLNAYKLIVARESITYNAVKATGATAILTPDPAFFMEAESCEIDERFKSGNVVGINVSPMIISNEKNKGVTYENYKKLVSYILQNTDMDIALIPHVVWNQNDDRSILQMLYEDFEHDQRIIMVTDHKAPELKYIISKCRFFVGARTHATIAAYSSMIPTLVVGYSVKARGIATDLFGTEENYVLPVQTLEYDGQLIDSFCWMLDNETQIKNRLIDFIPKYIRNGKQIKTVLERI